MSYEKYLPLPLYQIVLLAPFHPALHFFIAHISTWSVILCANLFSLYSYYNICNIIGRILSVWCTALYNPVPGIVSIQIVGAQSIFIELITNK